MNPLVLRVDPGLPLPVYEQLRSQVARLTASGQMPSGSRLPTIRQLAADLGLSKGTVERAYLLLEADGVVQSRGRSGTYVAEGPTPEDQTAATQHQDLRQAAEAFVVVARQLGLDDGDAIEALRSAMGRLP